MLLCVGPLVVLGVSCVLVGFAVGVAMYRRRNTEEETDVVEINDENYGTAFEAVIVSVFEESQNEKLNGGVKFDDKNDLEEAMLCSDMENELSEGAILEHLDETDDINNFGAIDRKTNLEEANPILEEDAIRTIKEQALEFKKYADMNKDTAELYRFCENSN